MFCSEWGGGVARTITCPDDPATRAAPGTSPAPPSSGRRSAVAEDEATAARRGIIRRLACGLSQARLSRPDSVRSEVKATLRASRASLARARMAPANRVWAIALAGSGHHRSGPSGCGDHRPDEDRHRRVDQAVGDVPWAVRRAAGPGCAARDRCGSPGRTCQDRQSGLQSRDLTTGYGEVVLCMAIFKISQFSLAIVKWVSKLSSDS
jgi:hypothetical protein